MARQPTGREGARGFDWGNRGLPPADMLLFLQGWMEEPSPSTCPVHRPKLYSGIKKLVDDILKHFGRTCLFVDTHKKWLDTVFIDDDVESTSFANSTSPDFVFVFASPTHTVLPIVDPAHLPNNEQDPSDISDYSGYTSKCSED